MKLLNQTRVRGSVIQFDFSHASKKLGKVNVTETAINESNARKKAMKTLSGKYKNLKQSGAVSV